MSIVAIANIVESANNPVSVGVRLLNTDLNIVKDIPNNTIIMELSKGTKIDNLEIDKNKIVWKHGASSRYPTISFSTGEVIKNINIITILLKTPSGYRAVNVNGTIRDIETGQLIKYGKQYGLSNAKVVNNAAGNDYISGINCTFKEYSANLTFKYSNDSKLLIIDVGEYGLSGQTTVEIPRRINGSLLDNELEIMVKPVKFTNQITGIILPDTINYVKLNMLEKLNNLRYIEFKSSQVHITSTSFKDNIDNSYKAYSVLSKFHIKVIKSPYVLNSYSGLTELEEIIIDEKPDIIVPFMFYNCKKLKNTNINNIVSKALIICDRAFENCDLLTDIELNCEILDQNAFKGCKNIKKVKFNRSAVYNGLGVYSVKLKGKNECKLLEQSVGCDLYAPPFFSYPRDKISDSVKLHIEKDNELEEKINNRIVKATTLGLNIVRYTEIVNSSDLADFIEILTDNEWGDIIKDAILTIASGVRITGIKGKYGFIMPINYGVFSLSDVKKMAVMDKVIILTTKKMTLIFLKDRKETIKYIRENNMRPPYKIPRYALFCHYTNLKSFKENDSSIELVLKNGEIKVVPYNEFN